MNTLSAMFASSQRLSQSAGAEAVLAGHPLIEVEDLFLALFCAGGESSRLLAETGITLAAARAALAVASCRREDAPGIDFAQPSPNADAGRGATSTNVDFSEPALAVLREVSDPQDDRHVLIATIDSSDRPLDDALGRLGVDILALREQAATATRAPLNASCTHTVVTDDAGSWLRVVVPWHLAAEPRQVRALITDPSRWAAWNDPAGDVHVEATGTVCVTDQESPWWLPPFGPRVPWSCHQLASTDDTSTYIIWETTRGTTPPRPRRRSTPRQRLGIRLEPTTAGTLATFEADWLQTRRVGQVRRKTYGHMMLSRVIARASAMAQQLSAAPGQDE